MNNSTAGNSSQVIPDNSSEDTSDSSPDFTNYYFPLCFLAVLIVAVNSFILILVWRNVKLRTNGNAFLVSLAVADGTTGLIGIPMLVIGVLVDMPIEKLCYVALSIHSWFWFMSVCSIFHLLVIACEQYLAILKPFNHDKIVTKRSVTITLAIIWFVSIGHALIPWTWILPLGDLFCMIDDENVQRRDKIFSFASTTIFFFVPVSIIMYVYLQIMLEARRHISRIKRECYTSKAKYREFSPCGRFRGFYVIALMWFVFVMCWAPYFISVFYVTLHNKILPFSTDYIISVLRFMPSVLNPLMFAFWKSDFRAACVELLPCVKKATSRYRVVNSKSLCSIDCPIPNH